MASYDDEDMDCSPLPEAQHTAGPVDSAEVNMTPQVEDSVQLTLSFEFLDPSIQKPEKLLEQALQSWFNKNNPQTDCSVVKIFRDECVIKITPAPAISMLQKLSGETLIRKKQKTAIVRNVSLTLPGLDTQKQDAAPMDLHLSVAAQKPDDAPTSHHPSFDAQKPNDVTTTPLPSIISKKPDDVFMSELEADEVQQEKSSTTSGAGQQLPCLVSVNHFWYVSHIYKKDVDHIAKNNGVQIKTELRVTFEPDQNGGNPENARTEFTNLVQKCIHDSKTSVVPFKYTDADMWSKTLKIIQREENKLHLTVSSEEMTVRGPSHSQDAFCKTLHAMQQPNNSALEESRWLSRNTPLKIKITINDPLADAGLDMEKSFWDVMKTSFDLKADIESKFNVHLLETGFNQDKVTIKAVYNSAGGNAAMESHAVKALLRLYQKTATSPMSYNLYPSKSLKSSAHSEDTSNGQNTPNIAETTPGAGASAGDNKDINCPICLDTFKNKKQLKCKHEFCEGCLEGATETMGPICPICRDIFGVIEGDQPDGTMTWTKELTSLPGFDHCGTIVIQYHIPTGKQTKKHPNPREYYSGITREAYLPDNNEGNKVLCLLKKAFDQRLIFTVGRSRTTGCDNQVTWNDIHHKTSRHGGPQSFGYPDPNYLRKVQEELKAKGIK
ncbi:uncharacterized protein LOC114435705 [Parambassis ranga]|uniref:E3 ubiquitin-protein ligase n=1 Tax=Parambassis ranga TaxID=210632 RepID=A0A6P7IM47_9TELE|nr:uncharacterized protein LOC114435705 [Parambassis ranga]